MLAQDSPDPEAVRILNTFNQYKSKYFQIIKDSLESNFKRDSKYYEMYPELRNLDTFKVKYFPDLRWNKRARYYEKGDNIYSLFDIDTIYYTTYAEIYIDKKIYIYIDIGNRPTTIFWHHDKFSDIGFNYVIHNEPYNFRYDYDDKSDLIFTVIGMNYHFKIKDKKIIRYFNNQIDSCDISKDWAIKTIRYFGWHYSSSTTPWWKFWEWKIFH